MSMTIAGQRTKFLKALSKKDFWIRHGDNVYKVYGRQEDWSAEVRYWESETGNVMLNVAFTVWHDYNLGTTVQFSSQRKSVLQTLREREAVIESEDQELPF